MLLPGIHARNDLPCRGRLSALGVTELIQEVSVQFGEFNFAEDRRPNSVPTVPVIVREQESQEILMLAYMNQEAFEKTCSTGLMHYYSRSRKKLWLKGETSGHFQQVRALKVDCDADTLIADIYQIGPACHTGSHSCFYRDLDQL